MISPEGFSWSDVDCDWVRYHIHKRRDSRTSMLREGFIQTDKRVPHCAGVYVLLDEGEPVYVGESKCIGTRVANHRHEGVKEFDEVFVLQFKDADCAPFRRTIESLWMGVLYPTRYNKENTLFVKSICLPDDDPAEVCDCQKGKK